MLGSEPQLTSRVALAQSAPQERPRLKDFGSSLKRLRWDPAKRTAVETRTRAERDDPDADDVVRVETRLVACDVSVIDTKGHTVQGMTQNDFIITEDGQPEKISHFSLGNDLNVERTIVLIIDYSGSEFPYINTSIEAAKSLVDQLGPKDRMAIVSDDVELLVDFSRDKTALKNALESLRKKAMSRQFGRSHQFSALLAAVRELFSEEDIRPIIIFQTDGDELGLLAPHGVDPFWQPGMLPLSLFRQFSLNDVYTAAEKSRATAYTIIPNIQFLGLSPSEQRQRAKTLASQESNSRPQFSTEQLANYADRILKGQLAAAGVATVTGGWTVFLEKPEQAKGIYARILSDINSRYVIGYYPTNKLHDGKRHRVLIAVRDHPEFSVEGRKTYYAPGPD
jgi:VWFA-related protein